MPRDRRPLPPNLPVFFTVRLAARGSTALIDHLDVLRQAVQVTKRDLPLEIVSWVVLPDHMHAVWRLPKDDPEYPQRWGRIKARFSRDAGWWPHIMLRRVTAGQVPPCAVRNSVGRDLSRRARAKPAYGDAATGSITAGTKPIWRGM